MIKLKTLVFFTVLSLQCALSVAAETGLSSAYLEGKWSDQGKKGCTSDMATYVIFSKNGTLVAGRGDAVRAVGFWELGQGNVILHLLVAPSGAAAQHPFYQGRYHYQYMSPQILAMQADSFDYTPDPGAEAGRRRTLTRCQ